MHHLAMFGNGCGDVAGADGGENAGEKEEYEKAPVISCPEDIEELREGFAEDDAHRDVESSPGEEAGDDGREGVEHERDLLCPIIIPCQFGLGEDVSFHGLFDLRFIRLRGEI